jgi:Rap1a immunity proteins
MRYAVAILLALTMPASAEDMNSANYILPGCKGTLGTQMWEQERCAGFIEGLRYGVGGRDFCPPNGVTTVQLVAVVIKYIEARPQRMQENFGRLAVAAMQAAWPCKR